MEKKKMDLGSSDFIMNNEVIGFIKKYLSEDGGKPEVIIILIKKKN